MPFSESRRLDPPSALEAFASWQRWRLSSEHAPLSEGSAAKYAAVWSSWMQFLATAGKGRSACAWHQATPLMLKRFLARLPSRRRREDDQRPLGAASSVSRTRYLRTLRSVYGHAMREGWIWQSPAQETPGDATTEEMQSMVLQEPQWSALFEQLPCRSNWRDCRDRALQLLLLEAALTVREIRTLKVEQVLGLAPNLQEPLRGAGTTCVAAVPRPLLQLRLDGGRPGQMRRIELSSRTSASLRQWMAWRVRKHQGEPWVFVSQTASRMEAGATPSHQMSAAAVFLVTAKLVDAAWKATGETARPAHSGPAVLRNSALVQRLNAGVPPHEVAAFAGLTRVRSLRRLMAHCQAPVVDAFLEAVSAETRRRPDEEDGGQLEMPLDPAG